MGSRIEPLVSRGDVVREGMVIAESDRRLSIPLHAPIPGRVTEVGNVQLFDGTTSIGLSIELSGEFDRLGKSTEPVDWHELGKEDIRRRVRAAGVVCSPRSALPAHLYLGPIRSAKRRILVLNLAEYEPFLSGGIEVAVYQTREVLTGLQIASAMADATSVYLVYTSRHAYRLRKVRRAAREVGVKTHRLPSRYPGITDQNAHSVVGGRRAPGEVEDEIFLITPDTAQAIYDAVVLDKPHIDRVIAVGGGAVARPAHIRVRIGTSIADVLAECGGLTEEPAEIIVGGPLTGRRVTNINAPITKTTPAVVALTAGEQNAAREEPCIGCGSCSRACPVGLNPQLLHRHISGQRMNEAVESGVHECIECGLCSYVCPARIPLVGRFRDVKKSFSPLEDRA